MLRSTLCLLIVFYAGAVFATGRSWFGVLRGTAGFSALRDLTGIGDPVALRRLFGMARADGLYQVSVAAVFRHRRRAGVILTDLPVHLLFLAALAWAALYGGLPATMAIVCAAAAHALVLGGTAVSVLAASRQTLLG